MNDIRKFLKDNLHLVDACDYELLYAQCYSRYRPELTKALQKASIDPLQYMNEVPALYSQEIPVGNLFLPNGIESISYAAFKNTDVRMISFPSRIQVIGEEAFYMCKNLIGVVIPDGIRQISKGAFAQCTKMETAHIGEGLRYLEDDVFMGCLNLERLFLPSTLLMIKDFGKYCSRLEQIHFNGTVDQWEAIEKNPKWNKMNEVEQVVCINGTVQV